MSVSKAFGCQCAKSLGSNFLSNVKNFDVVALVTVEIETGSFEPNLKVEEVYKGSIENDIVNLILNGCDNFVDFKNGTQIIIGLVNSRISSEPNLYSAPGCITSAIIVNEQRAMTPEDQPPMYGKPRIGAFKTQMKLKRLVKRIISKT